jgi:putative FmdB family regulatory protein
MPIYEYVCRSCEHRFETLVTAARQPVCPKCQGDGLDKQLSTFAVSTRSASGSDGAAAMAPCGTCGDPRGAGSCSLN